MNKHLKFLFLVLLIFLGGTLLSASVTVFNVAELETAVANANSGGEKEIVVYQGTYLLNDTLNITADGVTFKAMSHSRNLVVIRGAGMYGGISHIFNVSGTNFTARDMTIGWVSNHAVQIWGNNNSSNTLLSNLRIVDTYEQMVKISYEDGNPNRSENGVMENCLLEYSAGVGPQYYIGGIDGHQCLNWTVRGNTFKYISSPSNDFAEHAIHFWSGSQGTVVENNIIIDCDRGIGFGLGTSTHIGGTIRNNTIYHSATDHGFADVPIGLENSSNTDVYNNTVYLSNTYSNAIEYRFAGTTGGIIRNNLCNKAITSRDGGSATLSYNITNSQAGWFEALTSGDLHLAYGVPQVVNQGIAISGLTHDYDGESRPQAGGIDVGADEYMKDYHIFSGCDFDGDGDDDIAIYRAATGRWCVRGSASIAWGVPTDVPVPGDYDGNGTTDIAIFRPSTGRWCVRGSASIPWGVSTDVPVPGDYDGNGTTDIAVYRPSTGRWCVRGSASIQWGIAGDIPVPGDYDGNGTTDIAVFRPSEGYWYIKGTAPIRHGGATDIPMPADYDGNGTTDVAFYRPSHSRWYIEGTSGGIAWGVTTDIPVPADYDGNGSDDIAIFRPSSGTWAVMGSASIRYGVSTDLPLVSHWTN
ncbi:MAG: hypothetical protein GY765_34495 [bacterium]|nr:hypothetical protein [bacterium]